MRIFGRSDARRRIARLRPAKAFALHTVLCVAVSAQQPARDRTATRATGTATISGAVLAADTARPLRRARIRIYGESLGPDGLCVSTDAAGKYEFVDIPAGRYEIAAARNGYLSLQYGQFRPFERGTPVQIADRQALKDVNFSLPRMSVITGRIVDEANEPVSGATAVVYRLAALVGV